MCRSKRQRPNQERQKMDQTGKAMIRQGQEKFLWVWWMGGCYCNYIVSYWSRPRDIGMKLHIVQESFMPVVGG